MAAAALAVLLLLVPFLGGTPASATTAEPVSYAHTPHTPPSIGRVPFLSRHQLDALLANTTPQVDPFGGLPADELPPPTPSACGRRLAGTAHTVRCGAASPLGGIVLVPPRRATASVVFLHGYTDTPAVYLSLARALLSSSAPAGWSSSTRWVLPFAPRVPVQLFDTPVRDAYAWLDPTPNLNSSLAEILGANTTDVATVERGLLTAPEDVDRLGLFLSTRRVEAIVTAEHRVLNYRRRRHGRGRTTAGRVLLVGHSLGGVMATHVALQSTARLTAVVALQGFVADARRLARVPSTYDDHSPRGYPVELVAGGADTTAPPALVAASAAIVRRLMRGVARVRYTALPGVTHWSFFFKKRDADAVVGVLRRYLE